MKLFSKGTFLFILVSQLFLTISTNFGSVQASNIESSLPNPFVPEFNVRFVAYPYDVPEKTTTTIDPYTGKETVIITPGYPVENKSIQIWIKNQPFTPYIDDEGNELNLYYDVRVKGHFVEDWEKVYSNYEKDAHPLQSSSEYTVLTLQANYPDGGLVDFQVSAIVGYYYVLPIGPIVPVYSLMYVAGTDWSNTQTLTIENPEIIPEFTSWIFLPLFLGSVFLIVFVKKKNGFGEIK